MTEHPYKKRVEDTLKKYGGLHTFEDILALIKTGHMQSFAHGDSWAVTQICNFSRRSAVSIEFAVGTLEELKVIEKQIDDFALHHGIDLIMANGRLGFDSVKTSGWTKTSATYVKELKHDV